MLRIGFCNDPIARSTLRVPLASASDATLGQTTDQIKLPMMCGYALAVGVIAGVGAWAFRMLIGFFHNLLFLGELNFHYDANLHTPPNPWGAGVIFVPVIGALLVAWMVKNFAPEAKGHGVPEVMDAVYYNQGNIRPVVAIVKSVASALCIGSGGSVGREGPIIQIGSAFGSTLGQITKLPVNQRVTLIAAGAGAGIAATFNAPLGGLVFAIELLLVSINVRTLLPVGLATVTSSYIGRVLLGAEPAFDFPAIQIQNFELATPGFLALFIPFGMLMGLVAYVFVRGIYWAEDLFDAMPGNAYTRHLSGMFVVGIMIYCVSLWSPTHYYYIQGVGYATIMDLLHGDASLFKLEGFELTLFLLLLFILKLAATFLTLGSGGSGGVFSPSLFLGAITGSLFWQFAEAVSPEWLASELQGHQVAFVISGMAAGVGASTGAILTGAIMLIEMTADAGVTLPIILTCVIANVVRKSLSPGSVYTLKLIRRGHIVPEGLQAAITDAQSAEHIMAQNFRIVKSNDGWTQSEKISLIDLGDDNFHVAPANLPACPTPLANNCCLVNRDTPVIDTLRLMKSNGALFALIRENSDDHADIVGVITDHEIAETMKQAAKLM